jgi:hypothetical protein
MTSLLAADIYKPGEWREFFLMVGGGAAALTGLVFVAMSLNVHVIAKDATHRYRAIGTLAGFTATFMICALVLMGGQGHAAVAVEWLIVSSIGVSILVYGWIQAVSTGRSEVGLRLPRLVGGTACYVAQIIGSVVLLFGQIAGLYVAAVGMIVIFPFLIAGAWLLIVGAHESQKSSAQTVE